MENNNEENDVASADYGVAAGGSRFKCSICQRDLACSYLPTKLSLL